MTIIKAGFDSFTSNENISPMETEAAIGPNSSIELLSKKNHFEKINHHFTISIAFSI